MGTPGPGLVGRGRPRAHGRPGEVVGTGDPLMRGPGAIGRMGSAWARVTLRKGPGAPACHVSVEWGVAGKGTPQFRELVGSEAVWCPGVPLSEIRQRGVPAKGSHASQPRDRVRARAENLRAWPEFVWTPTQATGILVARTSRLSERRL